MTHYALIIMTDINKDTNTDINKEEINNRKVGAKIILSHLDSK